MRDNNISRMILRGSALAQIEHLVFEGTGIKKLTPKQTVGAVEEAFRELAMLRGQMDEVREALGMALGSSSSDSLFPVLLKAARNAGEDSRVLRRLMRTHELGEAVRAERKEVQTARKKVK